ncbi:MAG: hypothetical protein ACKVRN_03835 [Pyrinomonadaceae bacterium]
MKGMINALVALVFLVAAIVSFYTYTTTAQNNLYLVLAIIFAVLMVVFGGMFLSGRVNKGEEIHITE